MSNTLPRSRFSFFHFLFNCCQPRQALQFEPLVPNQYQYEPLPTHEHTRVLVLEPGPNDSDGNEDTLVGSLRLLDLRDADHEPFEAISYVWGPRARSHVIQVDGRPLRITAGLRSALLQTRLPDRARTLWADAICINQEDRTEKGHQVAAMGRIYRTSKRTLICLGVQYPEHARNTAGLIEDVNALIENTRQSPGFSRGAQGSRIPSSLTIHHLYNFARRHPEEAILFYENAHDTRSASTLSMLFETRRFELSDPRDRIYAFMALETNDGIMADLQLEPDYNRPHLEIYRDFAVKYIESSGDLDILSFIKHNEDSLARAGRRNAPGRPAIPEDMPSWIPRWDLKRSLRLPNQANLGDHPKGFEFREGGSVLGVRGLILGSVEYSAKQELYCPHDRPDLIFRNVLLLWRNVMAQSFLEQGPYSGREAFAFFDMLCPIRQFSTEEEWSTSRAEFVHVLQLSRQQQVQGFEHASVTPTITTLAGQIRRRGPRRFVMLSRGYYGVAPPLAQDGDVFALIFGTKTLSTLRPIEGRPGHYKVVGPVYVESKMVLNPHSSNMMGKDGCRDWEEWNLTKEDISLC